MSDTYGLRPEEIADIAHLSEEECWAALEVTPVGRLAVRAGEGVDIFPVNYMVTDGAIYLKSAPGSKLMDIAEHSSVAFEIDGRKGRTYWSVVVHGTAQRLSTSHDIEESGVLDLPTFTSSAKWNYVVITPTEVTGRRFTADTRRR